MGFTKTNTNKSVDEETYNKNLNSALKTINKGYHIQANEGEGVSQEYIDGVTANCEALQKEAQNQNAYPYFDKQGDGKVEPYKAKLNFYINKDGQERASLSVGSAKRGVFRIDFGEDATPSFMSVSTATEKSKNGAFEVPSKFRRVEEVAVGKHIEKFVKVAQEAFGFENPEKQARESSKNYVYEIPEAVRKVYKEYSNAVREDETKASNGKKEYYFASAKESDDTIIPYTGKDGNTDYSFSINDHTNKQLKITVTADGTIKSGTLTDFNDFNKETKTFADGGQIYRTNVLLLSSFDEGFGKINDKALAAIGYEPAEKDKVKANKEVEK